jgi:hypothetical protein
MGPEPAVWYKWKFFPKKFGKKEKVVIFAARFEMNREDHWQYWKISTSKSTENKNESVDFF